MESSGDVIHPSQTLFYIYLIVAFVLLVINGTVSGLTLALFSLDDQKLHVFSTSGTARQKTYAERVLPVKRFPHLLLCSLLLINTVINETLPILLNSLLPAGWISILVSTVLVLIFAEILPQSIFTHHALKLSFYLTWFVYLSMGLMFILAWPLAKCLDLILGKHASIMYKKAELREFVGLHQQSLGTGGDLTLDEVKIVQGTLSLHEKTVEHIMTKMEYVFMLDSKTPLTLDVLQDVADHGHSRIPVYQDDPSNIVGILLVKRLILLEKDQLDGRLTIGDLNILDVLRLSHKVNLFDAINIFQEGTCHLAIVEGEERDDRTIEILGIVTLEDVIEELLSEEILDEDDQWTDNTHTARVIRKAMKAKSRIRKPLLNGNGHGNNEVGENGNNVLST